MINDFFKYLVSFIVYLLLFQVMIIDNINFGFYIHPNVYILFLLILPIEISGWLLLFLSLATGITIDMFQNSPGVHASASIFLGFIRPFMLKSIAPRDGYDPDTLPIPSHLGFSWFFKYTVVCTGLHHLFLFMVEDFSFSHLWSVLLKTSLSVVFSITFIMIIRLFWSVNKKR